MSGWRVRFRRRIKILPGVRLNVSRCGLSWTFGGRFARITRGRRGTTRSVSLPGTGIYFSKHDPPDQKPD